MINKELIEKLYDQSIQEVEDPDDLLAAHGLPGVKIRTYSTEAFAEAIVRECIAQCNDGDSRYFIATHFGIEE